MKIKKERKFKKNSELSWIVKITITAFFLSLFLSYLSAVSIQNIPLIWSSVILVLIILIGIIFDIISAAIMIVEEDPFHAKATKKIEGSKTAIKLIRNSHKVASFCADVIGDITGILAGTLSVVIALKIMQSYNFSFDIQFLISALVSAVVIGGKAVGKLIAKERATEIVDIISKLLHPFNK